MAKSKWIWCSRCERCYKKGEHRIANGLRMCPYEGCSGDWVIDVWEWNTVRENHPEYPAEPERGKVYPMN